MPVISDCHVHTSFSADCEAPMEQMVLSAIQRGIQTLCFTEHYDEDSPFINDPEGERLRFVFDFDVYYEELQRMREKYKDRITRQTALIRIIRVILRVGVSKTATVLITARRF